MINFIRANLLFILLATLFYQNSGIGETIKKHNGDLILDTKNEQLKKNLIRKTQSSFRS
jgi:hypothetical protein